MSEHTPGPWTANAKYEQRAGDWIVEIESSSCMIGEIFADTEEGEANAHVIAAAPELLQALEKALTFIGRCVDWRGDDPPIEEFRTAIAKARGETQ